MAKFNELTRVQITSILHLTRLGYNYIGKIKREDAGSVFDLDTNILIDIFCRNFDRLNPKLKGKGKEKIKEISNLLYNDDLGKSFYDTLVNDSKVKLIDFDNPENNEYSVTAEFECQNGNDKFRPDVTLFINGLPLVFLETKKPNNDGGIIAEANRMNDERLPNKAFRKFLNITQLMIFSNNQEYETAEGRAPISGAFYGTNARPKKMFFNVFKEENLAFLQIAPFIAGYPYKEIDPNVEKKLLSDFSLQTLKNAPEYKTSKDINSPTNRILTSMCSFKRLLFLLKYGIVYVSKTDKNGVTTDEKHIMRYQQLFGSMAVVKKIDSGTKSGIIWHTQGSGKTALSYYLTKILTKYYAEKNIVPRFYFIVDRLDLLRQASEEFTARGVKVINCVDKTEFIQTLKSDESRKGNSGNDEITVVNIQKFKANDATEVVKNYSTNLQRVFFIDEAHRDYKPEGEFLTRLNESDKDSIKIAMTGTPLIKKGESWESFGPYYHIYYYSDSINDGYTLKLMREPINTSYHEKLEIVYKKLEDTVIVKGKMTKSEILSHKDYVDALLEYIIKDFTDFRIIQDDNTLGGMIVASDRAQAKKLKEGFDIVFNKLKGEGKIDKDTILNAALVLYDVPKEEQKSIIDGFKTDFSVDLLIVDKMLLTGFDAPRLKKMYLGKRLKDHTLLQALTRVNRPYKDQRYGYVVDFADIKENFKETNEAYLKEVSKFKGSVIGGNADENPVIGILQNPEELKDDILKAKDLLFKYNTDNVEEFRKDLDRCDDKKELLTLHKALKAAKEIFNTVRNVGDDQLKEEFAHLTIYNLSRLYNEVSRRIQTINLIQAIDDSSSTKELINTLMNGMSFRFDKLPKEELKIIDDGEIERKTLEVAREIQENEDNKDPVYVDVVEEFRRKMKELNFNIQTTEQYYEMMNFFSRLGNTLKDMERKNNAIKKKYKDDSKFMRVHKRIKEINSTRIKDKDEVILKDSDVKINEVLITIKDYVDEIVYNQEQILKKDVYFKKNILSYISTSFKETNIDLPLDDKKKLTDLIANEYLDEYEETYGNI